MFICLPSQKPGMEEITIWEQHTITLNKVSSCLFVVRSCPRRIWADCAQWLHKYRSERWSSLYGTQVVSLLFAGVDLDSASVFSQLELPTGIQSDTPSCLALECALSPSIALLYLHYMLLLCSHTFLHSLPSFMFPSMCVTVFLCLS